MMAKEVFNYNKYDRSQNCYYGFHLKDSRLHIDTKRLKRLKIDNLFPKELFSTPRNTHYFIPKYKKRLDYKINVLLDCLDKLKEDWNTEYKDAINAIKTVEDVYKKNRISQISETTTSEDYDQIEETARLKSFVRMKKYDEVIKSMHLQYLQKIFVEFFRSLNIALKKDSKFDDGIDFSYKKFIVFMQIKFNCTKKVNPIYSLEHYKYFDALNKIDNFLKHNTIKAYMALANNPEEKDENMKVFLSKFVVCSNGKRRYSNGEYSGDWLVITQDTVNEMIDNLRMFSIELCELVYNESDLEASWNSDEALYNILKEKILNDVYLY